MKVYQKQWLKTLKESDSFKEIKKTLKQIKEDDTGHTDELTQLLAEYALQSLDKLKR